MISNTKWGAQPLLFVQKNPGWQSVLEPKSSPFRSWNLKEDAFIHSFIHSVGDLGACTCLIMFKNPRAPWCGNGAFFHSKPWSQRSWSNHGPPSPCACVAHPDSSGYVQSNKNVLCLCSSKCNINHHPRFLLEAKFCKPFQVALITAPKTAPKTHRPPIPSPCVGTAAAPTRFVLWAWTSPSTIEGWWAIWAISKWTCYPSAKKWKHSHQSSVYQALKRDACSSLPLRYCQYCYLVTLESEQKDFLLASCSMSSWSSKTLD